MPRALSQLCHRQQVTHLLLPPPFLPVLAEAGGLPESTTLVVGGDATSGALVEQWSAGRRMVNAYGPTEMTVVASTSGDLSGGQTPPIGRPLSTPASTCWTTGCSRWRLVWRASSTSPASSWPGATTGGRG